MAKNTPHFNEQIAAQEQPLIDAGKLDWKWQSANLGHGVKMTHEERLRITEKYKDVEMPQEPGVIYTGPVEMYPFDDEEELPLTNDPAD
jgi:hypothetical protein